MRQFIPFSDRVLVRPLAAPQRTAGLAVPDQQKEKPIEGVVLAVGPEMPNFNSQTGERLGAQLKTGDIVAFNTYAGREIKLNGETLRLIRLEELDGKITEEA